MMLGWFWIEQNMSSSLIRSSCAVAFVFFFSVLATHGIPRSVHFLTYLKEGGREEGGREREREKCECVCDTWCVCECRNHGTHSISLLITFPPSLSFFVCRLLFYLPVPGRRHPQQLVHRSGILFRLLPCDTQKRQTDTHFDNCKSVWWYMFSSREERSTGTGKRERGKESFKMAGTEGWRMTEWEIERHACRQISDCIAEHMIGIEIVSLLTSFQTRLSEP